MENKKDIGKAFREKLEGVKKSPRDAVWDSINAELKESRKESKIPFWVKSLLVVLALFFIAGYFTYDSWKNKIPVIEFRMPRTTSPQPSGNPAEKTVDNNGSGNTLNNSKQDSDGTGRFPSSGNTATATAGDNPSNSNNSGVAGSGGNSFSGNNGAIKTGRAAASGRSSATAKRNSRQGFSHIKKGGATARNTAVKASRGAAIEKSLQGNKTNPLIANAGSNTTNVTTGTGMPGSTYNSTPERKEVSGLYQPPLNSLPAVYIKAQDSIKTEAKIPPVATIDAGKNDDNKNNPAPAFKHLYVYAHITPSRYYFPGGRSLISPELDTNRITSQVIYNYGAYLGFNLSERWGIRTGIKKTTMEQVTHNAAIGYGQIYHEPSDDYPEGYYENIPPADFRGVDYKNDVSNETVIATLGDSDPNNLQPVTTTVNLRQKIEFLEVPLELTCKIYETGRFGLGADAGFSMVYLKRSSVVAENQNGSLSLGSIRNISSVSFSANAGLTVYYKILPSLQLNVNPGFQYYLNMVKDVRPYSLGVSAGLQYMFNLGRKPQ